MEQRYNPTAKMEDEGDDKDNNIDDASRDIIFQLDSDIPGPSQKGPGLHINNSLRPSIVLDCAIPTLCPSASSKPTRGCSRPMY